MKAFAGEDHETAYVPAKARQVLARFDARSQHYELREARVSEGVADDGEAGSAGAA